MMPLISAVGSRGDLLDQHAVLLAGRDLEADRPEELLGRELELGEVGLDVLGQVLHAVVEARDGDLAVLVVHVGQNFRQHPDRVLRRAAEQAGVQVAVGAGQVDLLVEQAAQRGRHHRGLGIPHAGVADQREVELELVGVVLDETEQVVRAALLLALDHHGDRQRQRSGDGFEGATRLDEGHHLAFVVAGAARHDRLAAVRQRRDARRERRRLPQVERIDRLHVVVAVEQHARRLAMAGAVALADHDRMPPGRPHAGVEADAAQVLGDELGRGLALVLVGHVGRDRLDAQEIEQPLQALVEIGVDLVEHGGQGFGRRGHRGSTMS